MNVGTLIECSQTEVIGEKTDWRNRISSLLNFWQNFIGVKNELSVLWMKIWEDNKWHWLQFKSILSGLLITTQPGSSTILHCGIPQNHMILGQLYCLAKSTYWLRPEAIWVRKASFLCGAAEKRHNKKTTKVWNNVNKKTGLQCILHFCTVQANNIKSSVKWSSAIN